MGSSQSGEAEREVTVEERAGEDGQPQIIVTQDFLQYVQDREQGEEGEGEGLGTSRDRKEAYHDDDDVVPTAEELISSALPSSSSSTRDRAGEEEANFWRRKYQLEKEKNSELKHVTDCEFTKTVAEVREKFVEADVPEVLPICEDRRNNVLQCYYSNPGKLLLCSREVKAFTSCVETARQRLLQDK